MKPKYQWLGNCHFKTSWIVLHFAAPCCLVIAVLYLKTDFPCFFLSQNTPSLVILEQMDGEVRRQTLWWGFFWAKSYHKCWCSLSVFFSLIFLAFKTGIFLWLGKNYQTWDHKPTKKHASTGATPWGMPKKYNTFASSTIREKQSIVTN